MEKPQSIWRFIVEIGLMAGLLVVLYVVFELFIPDIRPPSQVAATSTQSSPQLGSTTEVPVEVMSSPSPSPYPPPGPGTTPAPYLPQVVQDLSSKSSLLAGFKTAVLAQGAIWLVQSDHQPEALVDASDVAVIYGWNHDGTKLLFGRGLYDTSGDLSKSTQLWVYDMAAGKPYTLVDSTKAWSASWSPVDDRVAYCEYLP